ncbi:helix-turn-helix domain-containing protein [Paraburkholderia sp. SARCC-3016]|uniref:helix-turn-helix domain-containing protein n=1 Tax=Paraburkholderia sp. SARCC-3016 TaxID=3058611 RepID=UPI00280A4824|nr:helix-turn-helix domain-containing protein [Paraburkholderia sp. SARCC-3016]MDQ7975912.1 helix-turn-helix domain-containing protein [Paraburkholderia sp. SARCC-3016]
MTDKEKAATHEGAAQSKDQGQFNGNDADAQRRRILEFLRQHRSLSTIDARHQIDVLHPAARVMELRRIGHEIMTVWAHEYTPEGRKHRVARYHLVQEASPC